MAQTGVVYNLRFPGQIYDSQAGLQQNWNRDYDPAVGRYVESDPLGLKGGINTYGYGRLNPLRVSDPTGQSVGPVVAIGIVVYSCAVIACVKHGIDRCARHFPDHTNPLSTDYALFPKCQQAAAQACVLLNFAADPFGSTATEVGRKIDEALQEP
jgi:RHS repeat-associated protein